MASEANESFTFDEELDDILYMIEEGFLDEDENFIKEIEGIVMEATEDEKYPAGFECHVCGKTCKSRRGLTRHTNSKHRDAGFTSSSSTLSNVSQNPSSFFSAEDQATCEKLHPLQLKAIVVRSADKICSDECFPSSLRDKFTKGLFNFTNDDAVDLWRKLKSVIDNFKGDAEKFYSGFFSLLVVNILPSKFEESFLTNTLMAEVGNLLLSQLSGGKNKDTIKEPKSLSEKEKKSLQYLSGFVLHKLYSKFLFSNKCRTHQQNISILQACRVGNDETQTLINARDRGGLWKVNKKIEQVFLRSELLFRARTASFTSAIACEDLVEEILKDSSVLSSYHDICLSANLEVCKEVGVDLLEQMMTMYFRVRTFSFAKDIREKHKISKRSAKKRSLRTEIKKSSSSTDKGH